MSKLTPVLPLLLALSAGVAHADTLSEDDMRVIRPKPDTETAIHKPGRIPWCSGPFTGEVWEPRRILRAIDAEDIDFIPDTNWERGVEHLCQFADDPSWQRQATYVVQTAMNSDNKSQDQVVERIKRLIVASQKERAAANHEPTDEERLAFDSMHLTAVPAKRGVDTVKLVGPVPWCDGLTVDERWDAGRIARNASSKDGIAESALHLCQRPKDATWQQKAGLLLQEWMNWTKQTQAEAIASLRVRAQTTNVTAQREALCKALVVPGDIGGQAKAYAQAKQRLFGCEDARLGETWQGNQHFVGDETGYYIDAADVPASEIARLYWLFASTSTPRSDLPSNIAGDNRQLLAYAAVAADMANLDPKLASAELSRAPFAGNDYARVVVSESIATLRWRAKLFDAAITTLASRDADYAVILRDTAPQASASWATLAAPWKRELDLAFAFEQRLASGSRAQVAGCSKDFTGVVEKMLASYKTTEFLALMDKFQDDPIASVLLSRIALCHGLDKLPDAGVLRDLARKGRAIRGRRSFAYFAVADKLAEVKKKNPRLLLTLESFWNPVSGGDAEREETSDIEMKGSVPFDPGAVESRGVVSKVTKTADGIRVEFKKVSRMEPEIQCKETDRLSHIDGNGNIIYRRDCWKTGKMFKVDLTPSPQAVPAVFATRIKPGVFAAIEYSGAVVYVKANADAKDITAFLGYAL